MSPADPIAVLTQRIDALTAAVQSMAQVHAARLTREQLCARLGIHRHTLRTRIDKSGFPAPGPDGKWSVADVLAWETSRGH